MKSRVVIFTNARGWHENRLVAAFRERQVEPALISLANCGFEHGGPFGGLSIPGFENELPRAAFVRGISAGSFQEVTLRLDFLHALTEMSVEVMNSARVIERTVDKAMTSHMLSRSGIPTVPAWSFESREKAVSLVRSKAVEGRQLVLKPLFGSRGRGLKILATEQDVPEKEAVDGVYYLQEFVPSDNKTWHDWRIMVVDSKAAAAMERRSQNWITNRAQGAECLPANLGDEIRALAEGATLAVGADYAGVDIIRTPSGQWQVLEVNGVPAWQGLQQVTEPDIAGLFADFMAA